jgi:hypothetical protein
MRAESTHHCDGGWISDGLGKELRSVSSEARAAAHATLRAATGVPGSGVPAAAGDVAADNAQELRELGALAVRAHRLLVTTNQQLDFPAALLAGILIQRHWLRLLLVRKSIYMDMFDAINQRRSVKAFDPTHRFTAAEKTKLLEAAIQSPTSFSMQD